MNAETAEVSTIRTISPMAMPTIFRLIDGRNIQFMGAKRVVAGACMPGECINPRHYANGSWGLIGKVRPDQDGVYLSPASGRGAHRHRGDKAISFNPPRSAQKSCRW